MNIAPFRTAWLSAIFILLATGPLLAQAGQLPSNATLSDQFGTESGIGQLAAAGTLVVLYSAEREAGDYLKAWYRGLSGRLPLNTTLLAVADLGAVPFFVPKNAIIKQLAADYPELPILLDWKGSLGSALASGKSKATATLYARGRPQMQLTGEYTAEKAGTMLKFLSDRP